MKNQRLLVFRGLAEEELEETLEKLVKEYTIISLNITPGYTQAATGNFLAPKVSYRYTVWAVVAEETGSVFNEESWDAYWEGLKEQAREEE